MNKIQVKLVFDVSDLYCSRVMSLNCVKMILNYLLDIILTDLIKILQLHLDLKFWSSVILR